MVRVFVSSKRWRPKLLPWESPIRNIGPAVAFLVLVVSSTAVAGQEISHLTSAFASDDHKFIGDPNFASVSTAFENFRSVHEIAAVTDSVILDSFDSPDDCHEPNCLVDGGSAPQTRNSGATTACNATDDTSDDPKASTVEITTVKHRRPDFNRDIYYRNRLEFGLDVGWHPVNIPFIYDFAVGDGYNMTPLKYTLVPIIASLRWHVTNVGWRSIFRGNMDFTFSGSVTPIPRGPETHYYSFMFGIRRNFVYRNWRAVPFFEQRGGAGIIDAKEPLGVLWAQGQNLTFTYNMGAGVRYNFNSKYSFSAGMNYMHISNAYLSEPAFKNYGINVYGPMFGIDVRLGKPHHSSSEEKAGD